MNSELGSDLNVSDCENENDDYLPYSKRPETYIVPVVFGLIFVIGTFGNGTLILIFLRHRTMRNEPNTYMLSLALGDLLVVLFSVPFTSTIYTLESWPYGDAVCKISEWTKDVSIGVSVFTLTALSADRYAAIVKPMKRLNGRRKSAKIFTFMTATLIWALAMAIAFPSLVFSHLQIEVLGYNRTIVVCSPFPFDESVVDGERVRYRHVIVLFKFFTYYAIPLCIIAGFYILMAVHLEASTKNIPGECRSRAHQVRARKKVAKLVLVFVAIFIICFGPYHVFMLWFHLNPNSRSDFDSTWNAFRILGFCLSFFNSCINPIALYFISSTFRKHFNVHLFCCCVDVGLQRSGATTLETSTHVLVHYRPTTSRQKNP